MMIRRKALQIEKESKTLIKLESGAVWHSTQDSSVIKTNINTSLRVHELDEVIAALQEIRKCLPGCADPLQEPGDFTELALQTYSSHK